MTQSSHPSCRVVRSFENLVGCIPKDTPETSVILIPKPEPSKAGCENPRVSNPSVEDYLLDNPKGPSTNNHILSKIVTDITAILKPSTQL